MVTLLLSTVALLAVAATPAFAIEEGTIPVSLHLNSQEEATQFLQSNGLDGGSGIKSDLCEYTKCGGSVSAAEATYAWAVHFWDSPEVTNFCEGPFGNGKTHNETQWACYGEGSGFLWQVNVDPWGEDTYHHRN